MEIQVLNRQGRSIRQIARETGLSRNTVRRYLRERPSVRYGPREPRACKLDAYKAFVQERLGQARPEWIPATGWFSEVSERVRGQASTYALRRYPRARAGFCLRRVRGCRCFADGSWRARP